MKNAALTGLAALTLLDIAASTPAEAQNTLFAGPYAGAHTGYYWGDATFSSAPYTFVGLGDTFPFPGRSDSFDIDGVLVGAHGGYNFTIGTNGIIGIEGDWTRLGGDDSVSASGSGVGTTNTDGFSFQRRSELEFDWQGTIRGRLGFVAGNTLYFATAGVAFLNVDWSETGRFTNTDTGASFIIGHSAGDTLVGAVIGAGFDVAVTPVILLGADYLYENFESFNNVPHGFASGQTGKIDDIDVHKVRARISVKFGPPVQ